MKKIMFTTFLLLATSLSQAAQFESCLKELKQDCGYFETFMANLFMSKDESQCFVVQAGTGENGATFAKKIVFTNLHSVYAIDTLSCHTNIQTVAETFIESKEVSGRVFNMTIEGYNLVLDHDNTFYVVRPNGSSYRIWDLLP